MKSVNALSPLAPRAILTALAIGAGLLWTQFSGDVMRVLAPTGISGIAYSRSFLASLSDVVVLALLVAFTAGVGLKVLSRVSGLDAPVTKPLIVHCVIFAIAAIMATILAPVSDDLSVSEILWLGVGGPVTEEIVFRGLAIGGLMQLAGWRFLPAAIAPAIIFGLAHISQGNTLIDTAGIAVITALGGLLFGWLFVRWGFNLWPPILCHVGLNALWIIFALGETAIGGWFGNAMRIAVIIAVILCAIWLSPAKSGHQIKSQSDVA